MMHVIVNIERVADDEKYQKYVEQVRESIQHYDGEVLWVDENANVADGMWTASRTVVCGFSDEEAMKDWLTSSEYKELTPLRLEATRSVMALVHPVFEPKAQAAGAGR